MSTQAEGAPRTPSGRALLNRMTLPVTHAQQPTYLDAILAIEAEAQAAPDALLREALERSLQAWFEDNGTCFTYDDRAKRAGLPQELAKEIAPLVMPDLLAALTPATPPASAPIRCWHGGQVHAWEPGESCPPDATPPASAERDAVVVQEAIAAWMHESRACKWTDFAHSMAHDEDDELRPKLAQAILDALRAAEAR